jgi:hypothetical protein
MVNLKCVFAVTVIRNIMFPITFMLGSIQNTHILLERGGICTFGIKSCPIMKFLC